MIMSWQDLLKARRVESRSSSPQELSQLQNMAKRALQDALTHGLSDDAAFSLAYDAARLIATVAIRHCGYRTMVHGGFHYNTFLALREALGPDSEDLTNYFDLCRQKRNLINYDTSHAATETEARALIQEVRKLILQVDQLTQVKS
jgi:hypothetical protein